MTTSRPYDDSSAANETGAACYVHYLSGECRRIATITTVQLTDESVVFLYGELEVERLPREEVYFCSRSQVSPPTLF